MIRPTAASQHGFLFDLPHAALYAILHRVGPRSRQLCKALLHVYGPLPRLTPRGLDTTCSLLSALAINQTSHHHLTALDLGHVDPDLLARDSLDELCRALPNLRTLRLPSNTNTLTLRSVAAAASHLHSLEALHAPFLAPSAAGPDPDHTQGWSRLLELTLPSTCSAPGTVDLSRCTRLSRLSFPDHRRHSSATVQHIFEAPGIITLAELLPGLQALDLTVGYSTGCIAGAAQLQRLTSLTSLNISYVEPEEGTSTGQLLQHVGALVNLQRLCVRMYRGDGWTDAEQGWLARLRHLTSLRVSFGVDEQQAAISAGILLGTAVDEVASAVPHLPALQELRIAVDYYVEANAALAAAAFARIASASSSLRLLHLDYVSLPATAFAQVVSQLTGLTSLSLDSISHAATLGFSWLTALPSLRELWYAVGTVYDDSALPCELLASLSSVRALGLVECNFVDGPYVACLCASMPQLTSLDLCGSEQVGTGLSLLQPLTNLEVLGLEYVDNPTALLEHFRPPPSLRRCYVSNNWDEPGLQEQLPRVNALLGRWHVEAVFEDWRLC